MSDPLPLDRNFDAMLAEHAFGWTRHGQPKDYDGKFGGEPVLLPPGVTFESVHRDGFQLPPKGQIGLSYFVPEFTRGWNGALKLLDTIHKGDHGERWYFSRRAKFYAELESMCVVDGFPVAWPAALGHFRNELPEFICRAVLKVATEAS